MLATRRDKRLRHAKAFCECSNDTKPTQWMYPNGCNCGEMVDISEWRWEVPEESIASWVLLSEDHKQVTFHPLYSSGTAAIRGDTPLVHNYHYYWEVKMITEPYGTDVMVGLGSNLVDMVDSLFTFTSFLGRDGESYGLSYSGRLRHNATVANENTGFCKGSIIGVKVDLWQGTLEFYLNRKSHGISFYNLRRHQVLYPMICSTAAQSCIRLIYAASWEASLLVDAAKILSASVRDGVAWLPPGLRNKLKSQFWLTLPNQKCILEEDGNKPETNQSDNEETSMLLDTFPSPFMNGYYVDNIERGYRVVLWQS